MRGVAQPASAKTVRAARDGDARVNASGLEDLESDEAAWEKG
jgi:hypothetical protein